MERFLILVAAIGVVGLSALFAWIIMLLWNWAIPLFWINAPILEFWQVWFIFILLSIIESFFAKNE